jgi:hypothetical protein
MKHFVVPLFALLWATLAAAEPPALPLFLGNKQHVIMNTASNRVLDVDTSNNRTSAYPMAVNDNCLP